MKTIYLLVAFNLICIQLFSQTNGYVPFSKPVSPSAYEFLKYDEMPVNEYSGLAEINIPIYQIVTDKIKIPIALTYHGGGIRVAEEASWVGLGWDLQMGNIVQVVNDRDDLTSDGAIHKILPDYYNFYYPYEFCERANYPSGWPTNPPDCFFPSTGIDQVHPRSSFIIFADYTFPLNGSFDNRNPDFFNANYSGQHDLVDSEPDIFKANFFGHTFNFIKDFQTGEIKILDKKGYKVSFVPLANNTKGVKVIAPDGTIFEFNDISESTIKASTTFVRGQRFGPGEESLASRVFQVSKITDIDGSEIIFNWSKTSPIKELPGFNQTFKKMVTGPLYINECSGNRLYFQELSGLSTLGNATGSQPLSENSTAYDYGFNYSNVEEIKSYLSSITFPSGSILFNTSTRYDIINDRKLDKIEVKNINQNTIKTLDFSYSLFIGHNNGMSYDKETTQLIYHGKTNFELANRLKLDSVKFSEEPSYKFLYNDTQLPLKSSYAVDYWGYYNGKTSNGSLIPNPMKFNRSDIGDNGNDHDAYENMAQAGSLEKIIYPTKGERYFVYELNTFSNPTTPSITLGNGLRIKETGATDEGNNFKIEKYTYEGGKLITPMSLFMDYSLNQNRQYTTPDGSIMEDIITAQTFHMNSGNFYTSSCLGSGNIVGYDKVTKQLLSKDNSPAGKTINHYTNNYDLIDQQAIRSSFMVLPARKDESKLINGLIYKTEIFKEGVSNPIRKIDYVYNPFIISQVFYGAKQSFDHFFSLTIPPFGGGGGPCVFFMWEKNLVGFYPIYSGNSLLYKEIVTDSMTSDLPIVKRTYHYYDSKDNISEIEMDRSDGNNDIQYFYYPYSQEVSYEPYMSDLQIANRINHPIKIENTLNNSSTGIVTFKSTIHEEYGLWGSKVLLSKHSELFPDPLPYKPSWENTTIIDKYDSFGNIQQYHKKDGTFKTILWGYNSLYPVAEIIGSDYNTVSTIINNQSLLDSPTGDNALRNYLNTLRTSLPNALVTTYTYTPLIGMTSQTDPKGMMTFYEYDYTNRLKIIRDQNGNIIKSYDYHYKQ